jgi:hypothetical protein
MNYLEEIKQILWLNNNLGFKDYGKGAILIGHVPHVAQFAYMHRLYLPLTEDELKQLELSLNQVIPKMFKDFLRETNGISIFSDSLNIYGMRKSTEGATENKLQPFSILTPNIIERLKDADPEFLFIGGYSKDGSKLYIDERTGKVFHCERYFSKQIRNEWVDFETMLLQETRRISTLFDKNGKKYPPVERKV